MNSDELFEDKSYPNFIDSELEKKITKIGGEKEIAVILSSGKGMVSGFYSTDRPQILTYLPQIKYRGKTLWAENIARNMNEALESNSSAIDFLNQFNPFVLFGSDKPTTKGFLFQLLIAGDIPDYKKTDIMDLIDEAWQQRVGYSLSI
jgi:hypothetical protein